MYDKLGMIKSQEVKESLKLWAKVNEIDRVVIRKMSFDHGGVCIDDFGVAFYHWRSRMYIMFAYSQDFLPFKYVEEKEYTIEELLGPEKKGEE